MAGYFGPSVGRVSAGRGSRPEQGFLPNGACGYRDLRAGADAITCGCRRFWLNAGHATNQWEQSWCFCGHHACFHDNINLQAASPGQNVGSRVYDRHIVSPSSHQVNAPNQSAGFVAPTWSELIGEHTSANPEGSHVAIDEPVENGLGIQNTASEPQSGTISARLWDALNAFARNQHDGVSSGDTSKLPSTAVPSVYEQPRVGTPTQALDGYVRASHRNMGPPVNIPALGNITNRTDEYSATEVATPSAHGTPDLRTNAALPAQNASPYQPGHSSMHAVPSGHLRLSVSQAQPSNSAQTKPPPTGSIGPALSIQEMCNTIQDFGERICSLESLSFSYMPSDTVLDKFDLLDGRVIDLEHWRTEQDKEQLTDDTDERLKQTSERLEDLEHWRSEHERARNSQQSEAQEESSDNRNRSGLPVDTSSIASDGSFDENAAAQTETVVLATLAASAETRPRIDALESRIVELEAALPSIARPWLVQVVLLPFSPRLAGIWFSASESSKHYLLRSQASEEWDGPPATLKSSFRSTASSGWTTESIEAWNRGVDQEEEWLSPKACGPTGTVFQRLASRGLIRDVLLHTPDSNQIWNTISHAFGSVSPNPASSSAAPKGLHGLRERFIPLRKVRKSTRLRFLSPAEVVTSSSWNAQFLESICMKVSEGERRLYLTTPEGYLQPPESTWSWRSIRSLPAYDIDGEVQAAQASGNVIEACWTYNDRLDHASSLHSSFRSEESPWGISSEDGEQAHPGEPEMAMLSPSTTRHSHMRSLSFPSSASANALDIEPTPKRPAASFEYESRAPTTDFAAEVIAKRRRVSTSPELERRGVNFTPRWSREPPSPYTGDDSGIARSSQAAGSRHRGTPPFAYATPHSHLESRGADDGGTEIDDAEAPIGESAPADELEEWEGVQDGHNDAAQSLPSQTRAEYRMIDKDFEESLDDESIIYQD